MEGFAALGGTQGDVEVVDVVLNLLSSRLDRESWNCEALVVRLIAGYALDQRVKALAKQELSGCIGQSAGPLYATVAHSYGNDEEIRRRIIESACPLPTPLRGIIATYLSEGDVDEAFAIPLLSLYEHERDEAVKTQASIGYHAQLRELGYNTQPAVETLSRSIVCIGHDYHERRQAAFCGLVILGRLDVMLNAQERWGNRPCAISIIRGLRPNVPLLRHLLQNWDAIKVALGAEFWPRLSQLDANPLYLFDTLSIFSP